MFSQKKLCIIYTHCNKTWLADCCLLLRDIGPCLQMLSRDIGHYVRVFKPRCVTTLHFPVILHGQVPLSVHKRIITEERLHKRHTHFNGALQFYLHPALRTIMFTCKSHLESTMEPGQNFSCKHLHLIGSTNIKETVPHGLLGTLMRRIIN
jgi:hypothetical protein